MKHLTKILNRQLPHTIDNDTMEQDALELKRVALPRTVEPQY